MEQKFLPRGDVIESWRVNP